MCVCVFSTQVEGKGNGIKTVIVNMVDVAKALCRPPSCKWGWLLPIVNWGVAHTHIIYMGTVCPLLYYVKGDAISGAYLGGSLSVGSPYRKSATLPLTNPHTYTHFHHRHMQVLWL